MKTIVEQIEELRACHAAVVAAADSVFECAESHGAAVPVDLLVKIGALKAIASVKPSDLEENDDRN